MISRFEGLGASCRGCGLVFEDRWRPLGLLGVLGLLGAGLGFRA